MTSTLPHCPRCKRTIPNEDFNISTDLAFCRSCNQVHSLVELMEDIRIDTLIDTPVAGTWKQQNVHGELVLGASHRSFKTAVVALAVCLFWNGIVSIFVAIALASVFNLAGVSIPAGLPEFQNEGSFMGWGMTIFLWCFLLPFVAVGIVLINAFLMALGGQTLITFSQGRATLFTGVGAFGWTRRFDLMDVKRVSVRANVVSNSDDGAHLNEKIHIEFYRGKELTFGDSLPKQRKYRLAALIRQAMAR